MCLPFESITWTLPLPGAPTSGPGDTGALSFCKPGPLVQILTTLSPSPGPASHVKRPQISPDSL